MDDILQVLSIWRQRKAYAVGEEEDDDEEGEGEVEVEGETPSVYLFGSSVCVLLIVVIYCDPPR